MTMLQGRRVPALRALGVVVGVAVVAIVALWLADLLTPTTRTERTFTMAPGASRLSVEVGNGAVRLTSTDSDLLQVHRTVTHGWREPGIEERSDGSGAAITAHCPTLFARGCDIGYEIAVPRGFAVDLRADSGDLDIRGVTAQSLRTDVSSGRTTLVDVAGSVEMRSSSGSISATGLSSADLTADVSSGSTSLDFAAAPSAVTVSASSGNVILRLPVSEGPYRVRADSSSGREQVDVPVNPASPRTVTVTVSSGDVQVLPR